MLACAPECGCTLTCSAPKSCLRALDRERLGDVDELAAAVVALARIALGVLVRHHRAGGFEHGEADEVLRRDELEAFFLAADFVRMAAAISGSAAARCVIGVMRGSRSRRRRRAPRSCRRAADGGRRRTACRETSRRCGARGPAAVRRAPSARTLASLCSRLSRADASSTTGAARTPATLLAAIAMPMPDAADEDAAIEARRARPHGDHGAAKSG